jgi:iron complex transport system substrate-binding protein
MSKKLYQFIVLLGLLVGGSSPVFGQTYQRIVSLAPSLTMNLYYLDSQDKLVGCTSYCEIAKPDNKPVVATAVKANIERILSLEPDLVLATSITSLETVTMLKKFGIRVEVFPTSKSFDEICDQFLLIRYLIGKSTLAESIIKETKHKVLQIQKGSNYNDPKKIFMQIGAKPLFVVIPNTFMDDYIRFVNGNNLAFDMTRGTITRESVVARNPDIIIIVTMGIIGEEEREIWKGFQGLNASKHDNIFIIDSNLACTPTPVSFLNTLELINNLIK